MFQIEGDIQILRKWIWENGDIMRILAINFRFIN